VMIVGIMTVNRIVGMRTVPVGEILGMRDGGHTGLRYLEEK
jgi:hypothetical protein